MKETYKTPVELQEKTGLAKQTITKTLNQLEKKNIVTHEKVQQYERWFGVKHFKEHRPRMLESSVLTQKAQETMPKTKISETQVRDFVRTWFSHTSIASLDVVLLPEYKATYSDDKKKTHTRVFDGVSGEEL